MGTHAGKDFPVFDCDSHVVERLTAMAHDLRLLVS